MDPLSDILSTFRLNAEIIHNAQYCGDWAIDTSGSGAVSFHLVTHGRCFASSECMPKEVELRVGDLIVFPHDSPHVLEAKRDCKVKLNSVESKDYAEGLVGDSVGLLCGYFQFAHPASNPLLANLPPVIIKYAVKAEQKDAAQALLDIIATEALQRGPGNQAAINRLTESLFVMLLRENISEVDTSPGLGAALRDQRISKALGAMHGDFERSWKVDELASVASMSRSAFAETFRALLNETPLAYLSRLRMQKAWSWLAEDGETVYAVALRSGYESEASFAKAFKKVVGVTPGSVRKK